MKIEAQFLGLPNFTKSIGSKSIELNLSNGTFGEVIEKLIKKFGRNARNALLDKEGKVDWEIQVVVNGKKWLSRDKLDAKVDEGDKITFMMLAAGG